MDVCLQGCNSLASTGQNDSRLQAMKAAADSLKPARVCAHLQERSNSIIVRSVAQGDE